MSGLRTPLKTARGLGSARAGTHHWIAERATAVMMIPLIAWFLSFVVANADASYQEMILAVRQPHAAILLVLFILAAFQHLRLGLQVVVEDYISVQGTRIMLLLLINGLAFLVGGVAIFAVLRIGFGTYSFA